MAQIIIHEIEWKQNSPYGGYVAGDEITIYYDDVLEDLRVYKNGVEVFSGNSIPYSFSFSGITQDYYKSESHYYTLICDTSNQKVETFRLTSEFPYLTITRFPNHPSCDTPLVCDLQFSSLPTVTNASGESTADGSITVSATSSNGLIEYSLSDFVFGAGQSSGTFSLLLPGNYTIYARDAVNCYAEITVTVGVTYTYGTLLRLEYNDYHANTTRVEVVQKSYAGAVTEVKGFSYSPYFWRLRGEGEEDKFKTIISTESTLQLISETNFQFLDLFTGDPDKYRVLFKKDSGSGYVTLLTHKLLPNQYAESYKVHPYDCSFIAVDGTASLKDVPFVDANGNRLYGSYTQIALIAYCLKKIGLDLNIRCAINMYASTMDSTAADDPLDQAYVDTDRYYLEDEIPSCDFVIKSILKPYGAQLIMWNNVWNILRIEERVSDFDYREFDENGVYVSNSNFDPLVSLKNPTQTNFVTWAATPTMTMMPAYGKIRINYDLGLKDNMLRNGDFRLKVIYYPPIAQNIIAINTDGFQIIKNGSNIELIGYEIVEENNVALQMTTDSLAYILSNTYTVKMALSDRLRFKLRFKTAVVYRDYPYQKVKCRVVYGTYYLKSDGTWTTTPNDIIYYAKDLGKYTDFEILASKPPTDTLSGLSLYTRVYGSYILDAEFTSLTNLRAKTTTTLAVQTRTELLPSSTGSGVSVDYIYYYELENNTSAESVPSIVRPNDYHATTNPYQWILKKQITSSTTLIDNQFFIDKIILQYLPEGKEAKNIHSAEIDAESNNPEVFETDLQLGSLLDLVETSYALVVPVFVGASVGFIVTGVQNAELIYSSYLRDSTGDGFVNWSRDSVAESRKLHEIYLRTVAAQYSRPWRKISGTVFGDQYFTPISTLVETIDSNRIYYPVSLEADDRQCQFNGEFVELLDVTTSGGGGSETGFGFTTGFSIGFDA